MNKLIYYNPSDKELIIALLKKEEQAIKYFMEEIVCKTIKALITKRFDHLQPYLVNDIAQDVFIECIRSGAFAKFNHDSSLKTFLRSIIFRLILNKYCSKPIRSAQKRMVVFNELALSVADRSLNINKRIDLALFKVELIKRITELKNDMDRFVIIGVLNELEDKEIANMLKVTVNAVQIRKSRTREILNDKLKIQRYDI